MKCQNSIGALLALLFLTLTAQAQWEYARVPGGVTLETVIVNETSPAVTGVWLVDKQGGMYWVNWNGNSWDPLGENSEYDAYHAWWMGGDEYNVGIAPNSTPYTIAATYRGTHLYRFTNGSPRPWEADDVHGFVNNGYYRWHDAAFYKPTSGAASPDYYVVSAVQDWSPNGDHQKGLYLIQNGQAPVAGIAPTVLNTQGQSYASLYRDLNPVYSNILYAYYADLSCAFQKIVISQVGQVISAEAISDFNAGITLQAIANFYQYNDAGAYHQFLVAESNNVWDVWHRERGGGDWSPWAVVCADLSAVTNIASDNFMGLVAKKMGPGAYRIYLNVQNRGLALLVTTSPMNYTVFFKNQEPNGGDYLPIYGLRSLNMNPWMANGHEQIIIGTAHGGTRFAEINPTTDEVVDYSNVDGWTSGSAYGARKAGYWGYSIVKDTDIYFLTHGSGLFRAQTQPSLSFQRLGIGAAGSNIQNNADFNFAWHTGAFSPFSGENAGLLYLGGPLASYYWNGTGATLYHAGLWKLNTTTANAQVEPVTIPSGMNSGSSLTGLASDGGNQKLYLSFYQDPTADGSEFNISDFGDPCRLKVQSTAGGSLTEIANTSLNLGVNPLNEYHWVDCWIFSGLVNALFQAMEDHPAAGVTGVIYGQSFPAGLDWGEQYGSGGQNENMGGGLGYVWWNAASSSWVPEEIVHTDHGASNATPWFENVNDMVVESNSSISPAHRNVDMLVATGTFQLSHRSEDYPRYGGLYKVYWNAGTSSWVKAEITPNIGDYKLLSTDGFAHPAVTSVEKYDMPTGPDWYFCATSGEKSGSSDQYLGIIWVQSANNIRELTTGGWSKLAPDGQVPYYSDPNQKYDNVNNLVVLPDGAQPTNNVVIFAGPNHTRATLQNLSITSNTTWTGLNIIGGNLTISNGATLTLNNANHDCQVLVGGNYSINIDNGKLKTANASADYKVRIAPSPGVPMWGGIKVRALISSAMDTLQYLRLDHADCGVNLIPNVPKTVKLLINHCHFDFNGTGITAQAPSVIRIANCTIDSSSQEGIYLFDLPATVPTGYAMAINNCEIRWSWQCGIHLTRCPSSLSIYQNKIHDNIRGGNSMDNGITCTNSSPSIYSNDVREPNGCALGVSSSGAPALTRQVNTWRSVNGTYGVIHCRNGFPTLNKAYNNIINENNGYVIYDQSNPIVLRKVEKNYWGVSTPQASKFYPSAYFDYDPWQSTMQNLPSFGYGTASLTDSVAYELLEEAIAAESEGDAQLAYDKLMELVQTCPEVEDAVCQALPHILKVGPEVGLAYETLYAFFDAIYQQALGTLLAKTSRQARNDCSVAMQDFSAAIADYMTIVNNPEALVDSVFAVTNLNQICLIMESLGIAGPQAVSIYNPRTLPIYRQREDELMALLAPDASNSPTAQPAQPATFTLHQNYPNPFNPTTTISYDLPEMALVKIAIYNTMGQRVALLTDGILPAGKHESAWNPTDTRVSAASGMYFCRFTAEGQETGQEFMATKKMLLLK